MNEASLPPRYDAALTEGKWYAAWEAAGLFKEDPDPAKEPYTITIPPPNITGSLHMGHALCYSLHDLLGRYARMQGKSVLIVPGQDHAGIATQSVVEKQLRAEGSSGVKIGRDKFIERVWQWREESGDTIIRQLRTLGCAFDWERGRFTLDPAYAEAVLKVFIDWFERGLIYRGKRVVNWDPALKTSVSDIETERQVIQGKLYYVRYPFADGSGHVIIATTRPETMLADVAVAVHPSDARYEGKVGKNLILPIVGREIPLIADLYPDSAFGSGAVKITPAHDPNDYEVGMRHNLPMPVMLTETAKIAEGGGRYTGMDRYEARKAIVADLEEQGFLEKIEDHEIAVLLSDRSKAVIEPLLSEQWFCRQSELANLATEAIQTQDVRFFPARYSEIALNWLDNIRDWNISRQLWWGHRIPVYYTETGEAFAALSWDDAQAKAGDKKIVRQDDDVLDTWFSSGLWPFATLGWPEETELLKSRYPTSVLITDRNILYLWVARMMMMGLDLLGKKPFHSVLIYATVLTEDGKRMSKSLGTGVDPVKMIETTSADALRYALLSQTGENQDLRFGERRVEEARNFLNKIWNATRFVLMNVEKAPSKPAEFDIVDKWLLSRLAAAEQTVSGAYAGYDLQGACQALFRFFWSELCDWYIEVSKARLDDPARREVPQWVLLTAIETFLRLAHPVMPHITEELYSHLPVEGKARFLMSALWPKLPDDFADSESEARCERAFEATRALRALRAELGISPKEWIETAFYEGDLGGLEAIVSDQSKVKTLSVGKPSEAFVSINREGLDLHIPVAGLVDVEKERARIAKDREKLIAELKGIEARLSNPMFTERAKPEVIERDTKAAESLRERLAKLDEREAIFK